MILISNVCLTKVQNLISEPFTVIPPIPKPRNILKRKQSQVETGDETTHFDGLEFCPNVSKIENHELQSWMNANCSIQPGTVKCNKYK